MQKNQLIILIVIVVVVLGGLIIWGISQPTPNPGPPAGEEEEEEEVVVAEVFSLSAKVLSANIAEKFLTVKTIKDEKEIKVVVSDTTKLIKLEFPFDPKNPPTEGTFTPIQTPIDISGFQVDDSVFIKSKENIAGKSVISNIDFIHILP